MPEKGKIAVKVIDHYGNEVLQVYGGWSMKLTRVEVQGYRTFIEPTVFDRLQRNASQDHCARWANVLDELDDRVAKIAGQQPKGPA